MALGSVTMPSSPSTVATALWLAGRTCAQVWVTSPGAAWAGAAKTRAEVAAARINTAQRKTTRIRVSVMALPFLDTRGLEWR